MRIITCSAACYCASPSWTWDWSSFYDRKVVKHSIKFAQVQQLLRYPKTLPATAQKLADFLIADRKTRRSSSNLKSVNATSPFAYILFLRNKVPTFKLSATLSNLNGFQNFCTAGKRMKFATKLVRHYPPHLRHVATLPSEIVNSNLLQIFSRYGKRKCKQIAFWVHRWIRLRDISRTGLWVCGLSSWLVTKSLTISTFLANVNSHSLYAVTRPSVVCLSVVGNAR